MRNFCTKYEAFILPVSNKRQLRLGCRRGRALATLCRLKFCYPPHKCTKKSHLKRFAIDELPLQSLKVIGKAINYFLLLRKWIIKSSFIYPPVLTSISAAATCQREIAPEIASLNLNAARRFVKRQKNKTIDDTRENAYLHLYHHGVITGDQQVCYNLNHNLLNLTNSVVVHSLPHPPPPFKKIRP